MKGDFSRLTGLKAKRKHYNAVLKQQGRVQLDSDWNELMSIISHQRRVRTIDTIGQCGAPVHNSGFQILHPGGGMSDLLYTSGRFYIDGLLCETTPSSKLPIVGFDTGNNTVLVDDTKIDGISLASGGTGTPDHWVQIVTKEHPDGVIGMVTNVGDGFVEVDSDLSELVNDTEPYLRFLLRYSQQSDYPTAPAYAPAIDRTDLLYLCVWERHITVIEDPELWEVALGGPDTDTRSKIIAQVGVLEDVEALRCSDEIGAWSELIRPSSGRLSTGLVDPGVPDDPCQLGESGGFQGLENQFYRVEIHEIDTGGVAHFKWSRDNAAFAYGIKEFLEDSGQVKKLNIKQNGKDEILKIKQQDWIEVSGDETDLDTQTAGTLVKVNSPVIGTELNLDGDVIAHQAESYPKIRRWDTSNQRPDVLTAIVPNLAGDLKFELENGIEIEFFGSDFKVGDYWVFSARTLTGEIERLDREPPLGIKRHYCKLALVTGLAGGEVDITDCRPEFPPLTELDKGGCCTVTVGEDADFDDIQEAIDSLNGGPGEVCIKPGVYLIEEPIRVEGNDIKIKGCGGTPIIINTQSGGSGIVFHVESSWDIVMHDLWCISMEGSRVVMVENTLFFSLYNCMLIGAGELDGQGIVTCSGLTVNARIYDNIILGLVGVRYEYDAAQDLNLHLNARVEKNLMLVLESGIYQSDENYLIAFDVIDNLMLGFDQDLMSNAFFPEDLYKAAEQSNRYAKADLSAINKGRSSGAAFDTVREGNVQPVYRLNESMRSSAVDARAYTTDVKMSALDDEAVVAIPHTVNALVSLSGLQVDVNITDNILFGEAGISSALSMELTIDKNVIIARQHGISYEDFIASTIDNNFMWSGATTIKCNGSAALSLSINNNRIFSETNAIAFLEDKADGRQVVVNPQISNNWINATDAGIWLNNTGIVLMDFTAVDNTIQGCRFVGIRINALDENQINPKVALDFFAFQRVIQRNIITSKGAGIEVSVSDCKILDNEINIAYNQSAGAAATNNSRGIALASTDGIISRNTIQAIVSPQQGALSYGGIYIEPLYAWRPLSNHQIDIRDNKILGGINNGIEIGSDLYALAIEGNHIVGMGLSGIAAQDRVHWVQNLQIKDNRINECLQLAEDVQSWWQYAAIVLPNIRKAQIIGNIISDNGRSRNVNTFHMGGLFARTMNETVIANNQFINNGAPGAVNQQAVIYAPLNQVTSEAAPINSNIQIVNNVVKSESSPCLWLGSFVSTLGADVPFLATDQKAVITSNHFEMGENADSSTLCCVNLAINECIFGSNYVSVGESNAIPVFLMGGRDVMANNNVVSGTITGVGINQDIINNLQIT